MTLQKILDLVKDKEFSFIFSHINMKVPSARIKHQSTKFYICQNINAGNNCGSDKLGYRYSWELTKTNSILIEDIKLIETVNTTDNYLIFN